MKRKQIRYRIVVAYDGTAYHGWQIQPEDRTVEGELTQAAATILDCSEDEVKIQGASRTDAGVHALAQVAHIAYDFDTRRTVWDFVRGLNGLTDDDICVVYGDEAPEGFHARHSARGKLYRYHLWNHRFPHPLERNRTWQIGASFRPDDMREAAQKLVGEHDFEAFRAADCGSPDTIRELSRVEVIDQGARISIEVEGTAFLKYMVRVIVGTLVYVGTGRRQPSIIDQMFQTRDRAIGGETAPSHGLELVKVHYPDFPFDGGTPQLGEPYLKG